VVSVLHNSESNIFLIRKVRELNKTAPIIVTASSEDAGKKLYRSGATLVLVPDAVSRRLLSEILEANDPITIRNFGRVYHEELHKNFVYIREI
jgi:Trk K+ transport system NAD-binding subunit